MANDNLPPITTLEEDLHARQNRIKLLIWEVTQAIIAVGITGATIFCSIYSINSQELTNAFFLIVGFYFSRTTTNGKPSSEWPVR